MDSDYPLITRAFATGGALLRAAQEAPGDGWHIEANGGSRRLVITDRMLADKTLRAIEAGHDLPLRIDLPFDGAMNLGRYLLTIVQHLHRRETLVADHPALDPGTAGINVSL